MFWWLYYFVYSSSLARGHLHCWQPPCSLGSWWPPTSNPQALHALRSSTSWAPWNANGDVCKRGLATTDAPHWCPMPLLAGRLLYEAWGYSSSAVTDQNHTSYSKSPGAHHEDSSVAVSVDTPQFHIRLCFDSGCSRRSIDQSEFPKAPSFPNTSCPFVVDVDLKGKWQRIGFFPTHTNTDW